MITFSNTWAIDLIELYFNSLFTTNMCWRFQLYYILLIEVLSFSQNMGSLKTSKRACNKPDSQKLFLHFGENGPIGGSKYKQNLFWLREPNCVGTRRTHFACTSNIVGPVVLPSIMWNWSDRNRVTAQISQKQLSPYFHSSVFSIFCHPTSMVSQQKAVTLLPGSKLGLFPCRLSPYFL